MYLYIFLGVLLAAYPACITASASPKDSKTDGRNGAASWLTVRATGYVTFTSPGYPGPYENNLDFNYYITGPFGYRLQFDVDHLELETCCDSLSLENYDSGNYSTTPFPSGSSPVVVNGSNVRVYFHTDGSVTAGGFSIRVSSLPPLPTAPGAVEITVDATGSVNFTSPGYPAPYDNNLAVEYHITGPLGYRLQFDVHHLELETCCDTLTLAQYGDNGTYSTTFQSGSSPLVVNGSNAWVYFRTDGSVTARGFSIRVSSIPPMPTGPITIDLTISANDTVNFTSPEYPAPYANNLDVHYYINGTSGHRLQFDVDYLELESCCDSLALLQYGENGTYSAPFYPGISTVLVNDSSAVVHFRTDGSVTAGGFSIRVKSVPSTPTGNTTIVLAVPVNGSVTFTSPGYPATYANNLIVNYIITGSFGYRLLFEVDYLDLESCCDSLDVVQYTANGTYSTPLLSGITTIVNDSAVRVQFRTDSSVTAGGFSIRVRSIPPVATGPNDIELTVGVNGTVTFTSPGYPAPYANNLAVYYYITGPVGSHLLFDINHLELENCCDRLDIIHYGDNPIALESGVTPVIVHDNSVHVRFTTDSSVTAAGFSIRVKSIRGRK